MNSENSTPAPVSVILTILNEGENIRVLLDALQQQTQKPDEIVIVDGGSTDGSISIINDYNEKHGNISLYIEPGVNIAKGRNLAIEFARNDLLAVTDGGCRPEPDWLRALILPLVEYENVSAVAGKIVVESVSDFEYCSGLLSTPKFDESNSSQRGMFYGRCSAFRRSLWEQVGGYPEWLYTAEDSLFAIAAKESGLRAVYAEDAILHWRPRPNLSKTAKMFYLYGRGNGRINWGSATGSWYWLRYYALLLASFVMGFWFSLAWLVLAIILVVLSLRLISPNKHYFHKCSQERKPIRHILTIILARNFCSNLGYLIGQCEYLVDPIFKRNLDAYLDVNLNHILEQLP